MPKKTLILIVTLALITGGLIYMALTTQSTPPISTTNSPAPQVTAIPRVKKTAVLFFAPSSISLNSSGSSSVDVMVKTQGQKVSGAQLEILFDPNVISNLNVTAGSDSIFGPSNYFVIPLTVDYKTGRATYGVGINIQATPDKTEGKVATLTFTANKSTNQKSSVIELLDKSIVTQEGVGDSILKETQPLTINFTQ